jgi:hypothetical protein
MLTSNFKNDLFNDIIVNAMQSYNEPELQDRWPHCGEDKEKFKGERTDALGQHERDAAPCP